MNTLIWTLHRPPSRRYVRKWTAHLQQQWQFGRTRFMEGLPMNDTLIKYTKQKFESCAAVGNSGGLLRSRAGQMIDEHDVVRPAVFCCSMKHR